MTEPNAHRIDPRDALAEDRTVLAAERTFAAWLRTGLAFLVGGLATQRYLHEVPPHPAEQPDRAGAAHLLRSLLPRCRLAGLARAAAPGTGGSPLVAAGSHDRRGVTAFGHLDRCVHLDAGAMRSANLYGPDRSGMCALQASISSLPESSPSSRTLRMRLRCHRTWKGRTARD